MSYCDIVDELRLNHWIPEAGIKYILLSKDKNETDYLIEQAGLVRHRVYGNRVFIRGLIEISNFCKNNCYYCGIRCGNSSVQRYRLKAEDIIKCTEYGYELGFRTFVLQGGEDLYFTDEVMCKIISDIKRIHKDCAITLSLGERTTESYQAMFDAGADRYLLRHETSDKEHYSKLHPESMNYDNRMKCLKDLKRIGYQTGCGMMVGSPYQTIDNIVDDLKFIHRLKPEMVGMGPFIPHAQTPFADMKPGTAEMTIKLLSIIRLMFPNILLPATTALATITDNGRELGICAGANVVMPNLSPEYAREKYTLYNNIARKGPEAAEGLRLLSNQLKKAGYELEIGRGDPEGWK